MSPVMNHTAARWRKHLERPFVRLQEVAQQKGNGYVVQAVARTLLHAPFDPFRYFYYKRFRSSRTFAFQGVSYPYFYHRYNRTWRNERAVEIPIISGLLSRHPLLQVLEVGNVLSHYVPVTHDVLDKYEHGEGVMNLDVIEFVPSKTYPLIVSISTLEHVGWDERPREPQKLLRAFARLQTWLAPGGRLIFTAPVGYNPELDRCLEEGRIPLTERSCLKRISRDNQWREVAWEEIRHARYGSPFPAANGVVIGVIQKPGHVREGRGVEESQAAA